jgi:phosphoribosylanthranilate isomerase
MRDGDNIRALEKLDIDWMGFIFYPESPRYVSDDNDRIAAIQSCSKVKVGVFVNEQIEVILQKMATYRLDFVQLHGDEPPEFCRRLKERGYKIIKVFSTASEKDLVQTAAYEPFVDYFLFDTKDNKRGGTGIRFDWSVLKAYRGNTPFLLSGGIDIKHIEELNAFNHPMMAGIDLNSRFELSPAVKDIALIDSFVRRFKGIEKS